MSFEYTHSERAVKKYTVGQAVASAERRLKAQNITSGINMTSIGLNANLKEAITLEKLNQIADRLVSDTIYWL